MDYAVQYFARLVVIPVAVCFISAIVIRTQPVPFARESGMYILGFHELGFRFLRMLLLPVEMDVLLKWILMVILNAVLIIISWTILQRRFPWILSLLSGGRNRAVLYLK